MRTTEPAVHRLAVVHPQPADLWHRLRAELDAQGSPPITFTYADARVTFESDTGAFMLRSRVAQALMALCDHDEWRRAFEPLD